MTMRKKIFITGIIVIVTAILAGFFLVREISQGDNPFVQPAPVSQTPSKAASETDIGLPAPRPAPAGYTEYQSATYHFSLFYPLGMTAHTYKEKGTAMTALFEDPFSERAFQVFVVPYAEKTITPERFLVDIPSGVRASSTSMTLDGIPAESFYSSNRILGDTFEIWFIYHGFLYEVTTYKAYDTWLSDIMRSWKFL